MRIDNQEPDISLLRRPLKMVVYLNQEGCEGCKTQAILPVLYMYALENKQFDSFSVIFILSPSDVQSSWQLLEQMRFRHTVFFDLDGSFDRLNPHLPKIEQFHTFLLNEENRIILVGNPVNNPKLKKLYLAELNKYHQTE